MHIARAAIAGVLESAGVDATKTRETARVLNVNRGLVWRLSRVVGAEDDVTAAAHLPGQVGLERLLEACRERGVQESDLEQVRTAVRGFHSTVQQHSGDRRTLEILLANAGGSGTQTTSADLESARRAMFEGGCAVWGVRAEVRLRAIFLTPNREQPGMLDQADVAGYVGFRRLRQVPWPMSYKAVYTDAGASDAPKEEPIDVESAQGGALPLLREFCVPRDLTIQAVRTARATRHELPASPAGASEAATCVFGTVHRKIYTARRTPDCHMAGALVVLDTPVERVILDTFVHRSLGIVGPPETLLLDRLTRPHGYNEAEVASEALPIENVSRLLGPGSAGAVTPRVPFYPRLIERVCERLGFTPDEFVSHRVEMAYPPIPTALIARYVLPE
ncbi:MAG TPA: hypothetical protein VHC70_02215 [Phycisphaerales bacterium]|nr:hypothetical protein [Phycisphaerales bacterium]